MEKNNICVNCKKQIEELKSKCGECGFNIVIEPKEEARKRYLRGPSLGALLFTQGWTLGARSYFLFVFSLIPITGIAVLIISVIFGRRISWHYGGWGSWQEFQKRMRLLDLIALIWVGLLILIYFFVRQQVA